MNIHEAVIELRKEYCEQCNKEFTDEEIDNGEMCEICEQVGEIGRTVAHLQD